MTRATFDVILATLLPSEDATLPEVVRKSLDEMRRTGGWDLLFAVLNLPTWLPRPGMFAEPRAVATLRGAIATIVAAMRKEEGATSLTHRLIAARDPETGRAMDDSQLVDNVLTFYLAGHETTAKALTWTLFLLSRSPEWTAALEEEIARVTGGAPIAAEHVEKLALTRQVIQESMRLYPPVPIMSRQCVADATLDGRAVPAGTSIIMPIYAIHRHARRWEEPDAFMPERFAATNDAAIPRYQYMPFGAGPRVCIGQVFAMMEAVVMLATFIQRSQFTPVEGYDPKPIARVTLVPTGGLPLRVAARSC